MSNIEYESLISEMETNAIIDTTCLKTVPGENISRFYVMFRGFFFKQKSSYYPSKKATKFGGSRKVFSEYQTVIPAKT